jgi:YD repeat-containing protein
MIVRDTSAFFASAYDDLGQMTAQTNNNGQGFYVDYDVNGKVKSVNSDAAKTQLRVSFGYDESGIKIRKTDHIQNVTTYYVTDVGGNTLAVYDNVGGDLKEKEISIYAASRIGTFK